MMRSKFARYYFLKIISNEALEKSTMLSARRLNLTEISATEHKTTVPSAIEGSNDADQESSLINIKKKSRF